MSDIVFDEDLIKAEMNLELNRPGRVLKNQFEYNGPPDVLLTSTETVKKSSKKKSNYASSFSSTKILTDLTEFNLKEEIKMRKLELNQEESKRSSLIETNRLIAGLPKCEVTKTQIYPMSSEEIKSMAVCKIISPDRGTENPGGLFDLSMGPISRGVLCITCGRDDKGCPGHMGYIDLPECIVNPIFEHEAILTADCICSYCGDTFINEKFFKALGLDKIPKKKLLKAVSELSNKWLWKLHDHKQDGKSISKVVYDREFKGYKLCYTIDVDKGSDKTADKKDRYVRSIQRLAKIFSSVPLENLKLLGFTGKTHPMNFIQYCIPVCPPCIRPPSIVNGKLTDHPLTERYIEIINSIIRLNQHGVSSIDKKSQFEILHSHIKTIAFGPEKKSGVTVPLKESGILSGLGTKKGIFRWNFMGKRVDCSARTVAGPGFELNFGEIMIPASSAKQVLLVPVMVTKYNQEKVTERYRNGHYRFMQMNLVSEKGAFSIEKKHLSLKPEIGSILLRPVENGDRGLVGRQPSLHKYSIQSGHFVLNDWDTVKIHNLLNHGLNADFDGDEFTYHILQDVVAMAESEMIMNSKYQILNDQSNKPMMAMSFHGLMGPYLMTKTWNINGVKSEVIIPEQRWDEVCSLLNDSYRKSSLEERLTRWKVPFRSGRALFSLVLPTNFTYKGNGLEIIDGVLIKGTLKKSNIGLKVMSLVQIIAKSYSIQEAARFLNDCQKISDWFVMWNGLSIGYKDFDGNRKEVIKMLKKELNKMQVEYYNLGPKPKDEVSHFFWMRALHGIVDKTKINGKKIGEQFLKENNSLNILSEDQGAGVKGSLANTSQITGSLGMQFVGSNIPTPELKNGTRCLPYYVPNDVTLESMGYVVKSYMDGIGPSDSYFHQMASRITLIDTARNVSEIGYTHRRVEKALEQILNNNLGMVISTDGKLIQPTFGPGWNIGKTMPVKNSKVGEKIFFCNPKIEADIMCRIYEKQNGFKHNDKPEKPISEYEKFQLEHGRFPKLSELV